MYSTPTKCSKIKPSRCCHRKPSVTGKSKQANRITTTKNQYHSTTPRKPQPHQSPATHIDEKTTLAISTKPTDSLSLQNKINAIKKQHRPWSSLDDWDAMGYVDTFPQLKQHHTLWLEGLDVLHNGHNCSPQIHNKQLLTDNIEIVFQQFPPRQPSTLHQDTIQPSPLQSQLTPHQTTYKLNLTSHNQPRENCLTSLTPTNPQILNKISAIDRIDANHTTFEQFQQLYQSQSKPVIISNLMNNWPACIEKWELSPPHIESSSSSSPPTTTTTTTTTTPSTTTSSPTNIFNHPHFKYHHNHFVVGSDGNSEPVTLPLSQYLQYLSICRDDSPLYLFDGFFAQRGLDIDTYYHIPTWFTNDLLHLCPPSRRPTYRWFIVGTERCGAALHIDPIQTSAWNGLISGRKRWVVFTPGSYNTSIIDGSFFKEMEGEQQQKQSNLQQREQQDQDQIGLSQENSNQTKMNNKNDNNNTNHTNFNEINIEHQEELKPIEPIEYFDKYIPQIRQYILSNPSHHHNAQSKLNKPHNNNQHNPPPPSQIAPMMEAIQYHGEVIYIPSNFPHAVINLDHSIAFTQNFQLPQLDHFIPTWKAMCIQHRHLARRLYDRMEVFYPQLVRELDQFLQTDNENVEFLYSPQIDPTMPPRQRHHRRNLPQQFNWTGGTSTTSQQTKTPNPASNHNSDKRASSTNDTDGVDHNIDELIKLSIRNQIETILPGWFESNHDKIGRAYQVMMEGIDDSSCCENE